MNFSRGFSTAAVVLLTLSAGSALAGEFGRSPAPQVSAPGHAVTAPAAVTVITQSVDPFTMVGGTGIACGSASGTTANQWLRRFDLDGDHGIVIAKQVTGVSFGAEFAQGPSLAGVQTVAVNLYTIPSAAPLTYANLTSIGSTTVQIFDGFFIPVSVAVNGLLLNPVFEDLVVEIAAADLQAGGGLFYVGANDLGEIKPSYIAASDCGLPNPLTLAAVGFPNSHVLMTVTLDDIATPTQARSWGTLKAIYR